MEDNESKITCPYRFEYIDTVPVGVRPHHHDRFSMIKSFGHDTTLFYQTDMENMTSCILYHAPTRTRWRLYFTGDGEGTVNPDVMTALIKMHEQGMF